MIIAIDGPAGSGKSTTSIFLANKLGFIYLDTGSMYRAITYHLLCQNIDIHDSNKVIEELPNIHLSLKPMNNLKNRIILNQKDVTNMIRKNEVDKNVSYISKIFEVREKMIHLQRSFAHNNDIVVEGRDIGSNVFPEAEFKFYLEADVNERARRRYQELKIIDEEISISEVIKDLKNRDDVDTKREFSPLIKCDDAIIIDTTNLSVSEQVDNIYMLINDGNE